MMIKAGEILRLTDGEYRKQVETHEESLCTMMWPLLPRLFFICSQHGMYYSIMSVGGAQLTVMYSSLYTGYTNYSLYCNEWLVRNSPVVSLLSTRAAPD